jgi:hypothetical protein
MKRSLILIAAILAVPLLLRAAEGVPMMTAVTPDTARPGAVATVTGEYLDKTHVAQVFLTDGTNDFKVEVVKQGAKEIVFKIPANMKPGRFSLMVLTAGDDPKLIEEPVRLVVTTDAGTPS